MRRTLAAGCLALAATGAVPPRAAEAADASPTDWRRVATSADRTRLRRWRTAWVAAIADARGTADGGPAIAADATLFDPDRSLEQPLPPAGTYRCRTVKLGRRGGVGPGYVAYGWFRCVVGAGARPGFTKIDGSQRQVGTLYPETDSRAAFLGTLALGDERGAMKYRRDANRDVAGWIERIGERRWRIAFPYPAFESTLDLMELVPV